MELYNTWYFVTSLFHLAHIFKDHSCYSKNQLWLSHQVMSDSFLTPWTVAFQAPSLHGIFQARIMGWVAISFSRESSQPRDQNQVSCIGRRILYHWATREAGMNQYFITFHDWIRFHYILFVLSSVNRKQHCFHRLVIMNNTVMNIHICLYFHISWVDT